MTSGRSVVAASQAGPAGSVTGWPNIVTATPSPARSRSATSAAISPPRSASTIWRRALDSGTTRMPWPAARRSRRKS